MRLITIGCEYSGKTTLADALEEWGLRQGRRFHMDDTDFSMPDQRHLNDEEQKAMIALPPKIKERFQRFQAYYHVGVIERHEDCILGGFHIEEAIYGPRYYYPGHVVDYTRQIEAKLPPDTVLVLLTAAADAIRARMEASPHRYPLVQPHEVEEVQQEFELAFSKSWIRRKVRLDTSDFPPDEVLGRFFAAARPYLSLRDLLLTS